MYTILTLIVIICIDIQLFMLLFSIFMYYFDVIYLFRYFVTKHLTNHDKCAIFIIVERMPKFKLFSFFTDLFVWYCTTVFNANLILVESIKLLKAKFFF